MTERAKNVTVRLQDLENFTSNDIEASLKRADPVELQLVSITIALSFPDMAIAQDACVKLCSHEDHKVRGNAVISLGYLARRFRVLDEQLVKPVIESALRDGDEDVRTLAASAADEIHQFLHWQIAGHVYG